MTNIELVLTARTPIVKFEDPTRKIKADLSYGNHLGVLKADLIRFFCSVDPRVRDLILVVKHWAKKRNINDSTSYTLNSFVYTLLVIHFLQQRQPSIVPTLKIHGKQENSHLLEKQTKIPINNPLELILFPIYDFNFPPVHHQNTESFGDLLLLFFRHYALDFDYEKHCVCVRLGKSISKQETLISQTSTPQIFCVGDPFILTENCARTVGNESFISI